MKRKNSGNTARILKIEIFRHSRFQFDWANKQDISTQTVDSYGGWLEKSTPRQVDVYEITHQPCPAYSYKI